MFTVSPVSDELGNTKPTRKRSRGWVLTVHNYDDEHIRLLSQTFEKYIIGKEVCPTTQRKHLQVFGYSSSQISFSTLKDLFPTAHMQPQKGTIDQNLKYCSKEKDYITNLKVRKPIKTILLEDFYPWQKEVYDIVIGEPHDRRIYWYWEPNGNIGKSALCKYLAVHLGACVITTAKSADIATCIDEDCSIYIFDFPRSSEGFSPWNGLEQLKNGLITEAKLKKKAKTTIIDPPHIIVFANFEPRDAPMSTDRVHVKRL